MNEKAPYQLIFEMTQKIKEIESTFYQLQYWIERNVPIALLEGRHEEENNNE